MEKWKVKRRPEDIFVKPEFYYTDEEIKRYAKSKNIEKKQKKLTERLLQLLKLNPPKKIIDLGCGVGFSSIYLKEKGFDVIGVDVIEKMLEIARNKGIKVKKADMRELDKIFKKETFDAVISVSALQWIPLKDIKKVAKSIFKILKKEGKVGIQFYPKSYKEMINIGKIFKNVGFNVKFVVDNPDIPKKRVIFMICKKFKNL